ncbi:MAG: type II secretion system ATPase GspE [Gammaproteobacteria bacterium]|nr:type II secretion system ATPase GspE [Gammaproteobacteria bacterium]MDH5799973.1 type II secretion system ATPase GspE [Gammaproteobacteria bacterium]
MNTTPDTGLTQIGVNHKGHDPFTQYLIDHELLKRSDLGKLCQIQSDSTDTSAATLFRLGLVSAPDIAAALSAITTLPIVAADECLPDEQPRMSPRYLRAKAVIPLRVEAGQVVVVMGDPRDTEAVQAVGVAYGKPVQVQLGLFSHIHASLERCFSDQDQAGQDNLSANMPIAANDSADVEHLRDLASEAPVIRSVNQIIQQAVELGASDIHLEPFEERLQLRFRVDGVLRQIAPPDYGLTAAIVSRIKIMARLDIAERRLPQDGRIPLKVSGKDIDLRIATAPTLYGESVVIRLLDKAGVTLDFSGLGFDGELLREFTRLLTKPHGIVLVTGPTGSGKTTTLYAALSSINSDARKIVSVEDPVEYQLDGVNQIAAKPQIGLSFANALRSIVRQDPDIIMIGEMRDTETARIAVQSALTGHLVLSTLHTNDAAGAITRLLDMGLEEYLLTSTVNGVLAQRLVRTLCPHCRDAYTLASETVRELGLEQRAQQNRTGELLLYKAVGCGHCSGSGYVGRTAVLELMSMSESVKKQILCRADAGTIKQTAVAQGMRTMFDNGINMAMEGITSLEEILRVTRDF